VAIDRQELPGAGHATQLGAAAVLEADARADDQITDGARDEDYRRDDNRGPGDGTLERGIENQTAATQQHRTPVHYPGMAGLAPTGADGYPT
jgi:hypothetical protein